ncbi:MAG TPA: AI-2E family transporter [Polyangia bacterium]|nr:AI-2E family transporter [Polyangia bacterium]
MDANDRPDGSPERASEPATRRFFFALFLIAGVLVALVARPVASALFLAASFSAVLWPAHRALTRRLGRRPLLSAILLVVGFVLAVVGPSVAFGIAAVDQLIEGEEHIADTLRNEGAVGLVHRLPPGLERVARLALDHLSADTRDDVTRLAAAQSAKITAAIAGTLSAAGKLAFQAAMMLVALFALLVGGDRLVSWIDALSPLERGQTRELLREFRKTAYAVVVSTVVTAAIQTVMAFFGYLVARVPHPFFIAGVTFFIAFIPAVGAGGTALGAAALLFMQGHKYSALFLAAWALLVVSLIDEVVKPLLIKGGMEMSGTVVFFALVGGLITFGGVGLLLGPLAVALFLALVRMYQRDFRAAR